MLGPLLSAGSSLLGGLLGKSSQDKANQIAQENAQRNIDLQREFANHAISWKVADAKRAGIHPLYALGASTTSFSPVSVGVSGASPLGDAISSMGQDLSRAAGSMMSPRDKVGGVAAAQQTVANSLSLENQSLQNKLLRARLAQLTQPATPPGVGGPFDTFQEQTGKPEGMPPLMVGGKRLPTDPGTSSMEAFEKRYGDEGPASWAFQTYVADRDLQYNFGSPATWPGQVTRWAKNALWEDIVNEGRNARRFGKRYLPGVIGP